MKATYFFDMDGTLAHYDRWVYEPDGQPWYEKIRGTHYFRHLLPHMQMVDLVNRKLQECPGRVYILTSVDVPQEIFYEHTADKIHWVNTHLSGLLPEHFLVVHSRRPGKGKQTKSDVAIGTLQRPLSQTDYLYDDFNPNLENWKVYRGTPIKVLNGINHDRPDMETITII